LHEALAKISNDFSLLRTLPLNIPKKAMFFHYGHHFIFIQIAKSHLPEKIHVCSILHEKMDLPSRLSEQLPGLFIT
jgi:plasmid stabilization system protein ParE